MQHDLFTVGAGYLNVWAALNSSDVVLAGRSALSPKTAVDPKTRNKGCHGERCFRRVGRLGGMGDRTNLGYGRLSGTVLRHRHGGQQEFLSIRGRREHKTLIIKFGFGCGGLSRIDISRG